MFDNTVPRELIDGMSENFIAVQGVIKAFRVLLKTDWQKLKQEMRLIKQELSLLNPEQMIPQVLERSRSIQRADIDKPTKNKTP